MPLRKICSDKPLKPGTIREKPGNCFSRGLKIGFAIAMRQQRQQPRQQLPRQPQQPTRQRRSLAEVIRNKGGQALHALAEIAKQYDPSWTTGKARREKTEGVVRFLVSKGFTNDLPTLGPQYRKYANIQ